MADAFSLNTRFGVNNVLIPKEGPVVVPGTLNFENTAEIEISGEMVITQGKISFIQGVFIDNADNTDKLTLTIGNTNQRIVCPANSQGYFPLLTPNPPIIVARTTQGGGQIIPLFFYNVPIQSIVWTTE